MRTTKLQAIVTFVLAVSSASTQAVVDQTLQVQCTNLILSWPSLGYEYYMIEYRHTLDESTPWEVLTNNYHANSTNRSTYTIYGVAANACGGGASMAAGGGNGDDLEEFEITETMATPKSGLGATVPLKLYPPPLRDTNKLYIFETNYSVWRPKGWSLRGGSEQDGPGEDGPPAMGFFRVWHIPDWLGSVTNFTFDGPTFIAVDFKDYRDRVANIEVLLDGQPTADAVLTSFDYQGITYWGMGVYFDLYPSGSHTLQLRTTLRINEKVGDGSVFLVLSNLTRSITVDNEVSFTNWDGLIQTTNFTFVAQTKTNNTDWWIDIYDAYNNYVNGGSGHTTNGQVSWTWDLTDTFGYLRDDIDSDPFFYSEITYDAPSGQQKTKATPAAQTAYPATGYWLFTYLDRYYLDVAPNTYANVQGYYTSAINSLVGGPNLRGIPASVYPIKYGTNVYSQQDRDDSWVEVKARLYDAHNRNFYYKGHGNANTIGCDMHEFDTNNSIVGGLFLRGSKAYISSQNISNEITFNRYGGSRPYRFVWLDGCSTANGDWPGAFGVGKSSYDVGYYTNSTSNPTHRRPSAFVGWNRTVGFGGEWGGAQASFNFRTQWMTAWYYNWQTEGLVQAFKDAVQTANWPPQGESQLFDALKIYGYTNLLMNGYNQKGDWRWP